MKTKKIRSNRTKGFGKRELAEVIGVSVATLEYDRGKGYLSWVRDWEQARGPVVVSAVEARRYQDWRAARRSTS